MWLVCWEAVPVSSSGTSEGGGLSSAGFHQGGSSSRPPYCPETLRATVLSLRV